MAYPNASTLFESSDLAMAIEGLSAPGVRAALSAGADPNAKGPGGVTPLAFAAAQPGAAEIIKILGEAGGDPNIAGPDGHTAVTLAVLAAQPSNGTADLGNIEAVLAIGGGANAIFPNGDPAIVWGIGQNNPALLKRLLTHGADPDARSRTGDPAAIDAALGKYWDAVLCLIEGGADWRIVHKGFSVPGLAGTSGLPEHAPLHTDWQAVYDHIVAEGLHMPAPTPRELGFASGRLTNDGFVPE